MKFKIPLCIQLHGTRRFHILKNPFSGGIWAFEKVYPTIEHASKK
jgi:hypothetical protein